VFTAEELEAQCSEYYHIDTDDNEKASAILVNKLGINKLEIMDDGTIRIYDGLERIREVSKTLYDNDVIPVLLAKNEMNLEDYYMKMVEKDLG
jgi:ABC-2 type transport system ATP-binding protein